MTYPYKSLLFDGSTQFMNIHLLSILQDEYFNSREFGDKKNLRELMLQTETDWAIYNTIAFQMLRVFKMLRKIAGNQNPFLQIYGGTGVGKTVSLLASMPEPILYIDAEDRPVDISLAAIEESEKRKPEVHQEHFEDPRELIPYLSEQIGLGAKGLFACVVALSKTVNHHRWVTERGKRIKVTDPKFLELMKIFEKQEYNDLFSYTLPNYEGDKFIKSYPGMLDYIGLVVDRYKDGKIQFPPMVKFERDEDYLGKWTGARKGRRLEGPLDLRRIFKL